MSLHTARCCALSLVSALAVASAATAPVRRPAPMMAHAARRTVLRGGLGAALTAIASPQIAGAASTEPVVTADELAQWRAKLAPAQYKILFGRGTEPPFSSPLVKEKRRGTFSCAACGTPLFVSNTKFDSGTGWPSFYAALDGVQPVTDNMAVWALLGTEVHCKKCNGHLGDLFADGYMWGTPTSLRYCIDGLALAFDPESGGKA
jgi:peptide-methionine (R)-S-oxide reductase